MADFCHEFDPGGLGCPHPGPCAEVCFGDFKDAWGGEIDELNPGYEMILGICEGHGITVVVVNIDGRLVMQHVGAADVLI